MIERVVPAEVASAESFGDPPDASALAAESPIVARAVDKRRREFVTTRHCARIALGKLGMEPQPIMRGENGEPLWPARAVGSLTHTDGYRAAVTAWSLQVRSLGIDAEPHDALPEGVLDHVSLPAERHVLAARDPDLHWDRILFCAKEATYKTWNPLTHRWLGFEDAHITFEQVGNAYGTFHSELLVDGRTDDGGAPLTAFDGQWLVADGYILTAICLR
ncbi:4'-phosphopantetheinyl transferase family protein [Williamsia sterculiae]|uniref:4'-phosphopantetheinyl transferase EntD (Siderophore biosynthesis) n=1 Tax=Williamsia sterculiae TaxID=1344003 RepID=A0A1N7ECE7_9NOCA|nr:4'-phosphopantetheinyl transferase superfamily protein [Williamsia sterculiae]SIR85734.1 4'-phosphopantetheinyl transferase EntD (siderophore biosynthesis) [Williamsia sterculiae]